MTTLQLSGIAVLIGFGPILLTLTFNHFVSIPRLLHIPREACIFLVIGFLLIPSLAGGLYLQDISFRASKIAWIQERINAIDTSIKALDPSMPELDGVESVLKTAETLGVESPVLPLLLEKYELAHDLNEETQKLTHQLSRHKWIGNLKLS